MTTTAGGSRSGSDSSTDVQKLIAKYGTAAHLAMLAVAPLFLFPFWGERVAATVLLWLSLFAFCWLILEPSLRSGEALHQARKRVLREILRDPLFWASLFLLLVTGVRALNDGISLVYDAENAKWNVAPSLFPLLPGCVKGTGDLPFAALLAGTVLMQGCRHALGRSARMCFLMVSSFLAGLAAVLAIFAGASGAEAVKTAIACPVTESFYVGVAFYLHLLGGTVALFAAFERKWNLVMPLFAFAIGGTSAAGFLFSPVVVSLVFLSAELLLLVIVFISATKTLAASGEFKLLVVSGLSFVLGGLLVMTVEPGAATVRIASFKSLEFLPASFVSVRETLSGVSLRTWLPHLWLGTGLGSFPLDFRFHATPDDWRLVRMGAQAVPNAWWLLLAERGVVGALIVGLPVGFLLFSYVRRLIGWVGTRTLPHPCCFLGPFVLVVLVTTGLYCCALFRADVTIVALAMLAVSANSFPRGKRKDNG